MLLRTAARYIQSSASTLKTIPSNLKGKSKASQEWLTRHFNDPYVIKSRELNYRARSAFKLIEIDQRFKLLRRGMTVIECGAAPGAWSQVIVSRINSDGHDPNAPKGKVIGIDLLPIEQLSGATFLSNADFSKPEVRQLIRQALGASTRMTNNLVDLILSDMAPNASGIPGLDQANLSNLVDSCITFALEEARPGSKFVCKVYQGSDLAHLETRLKDNYKVVHRFKPKSSRENSSEIYLVAINKNK